MLSVEHPIVRAATHNPRVLARFWTFVDRREPADECWGWRGRRGGANQPLFTVKYHAVAAARFAWFAATGEFPVGGKLRHSCENPDCVRPDHLELEVGSRTERMLRAKSDGYVSVLVATNRTASPGGDTLFGDTPLRRAG